MVELRTSQRLLNLLAGADVEDPPAESNGDRKASGDSKPSGSEVSGKKKRLASDAPEQVVAKKAKFEQMPTASGKTRPLATAIRNLDNSGKFPEQKPTASGKTGPLASALRSLRKSTRSVPKTSGSQASQSSSSKASAHLSFRIDADSEYTPEQFSRRGEGKKNMHLAVCLGSAHLTAICFY